MHSNHSYNRTIFELPLPDNICYNLLHQSIYNNVVFRIVKWQLKCYTLLDSIFNTFSLFADLLQHEIELISYTNQQCNLKNNMYDNLQ